MGKKNRNKHFTKPDDTSIEKRVQKPRISSEKSKELNELVAQLFRVASVLNNTANVNKELELFKDLQKNLSQIIEIESEYFQTDKPQRNAQSLNDLIKWAKDNGCSMDSISIKECDQYGYGVFATRDIKETEPIILVPRKLMITSEHILDSPLKNLYQSNPLIWLMPNVALALYLLYEKFQGEESFWKAYIDFLPSEYNTVLYFSADDFLHLKGSLTFESALKQCRNIVRQYAHFKNLFQSGTDEVSKLFRKHFTYDLYRWAVSTVMTRINIVPSEKDNSQVHALIPIWDMCNHENGRIFTYYEPEQHISACYAHRDFRSGEQVFIFYGSRRNADFLVQSGFFYPGNEFDGVKILLGISKSDPYYDVRTQLLNKIKISSTSDFILSPNVKYIEGELLAFLRVFNMTKDQLDSYLQKDEKEIQDLLEFGSPVDATNEKKTWQFLSTRIKLLLSAYPSSDESDMKNLQNGSLSYHAQMCINFCLAEKKMLRKCLALIEQIDVPSGGESHLGGN